MLANLSPMRALDRQRGQLFPWVAVLYATGIGVFFLWPVDPPKVIWLGVGVGSFCAAIVSLFTGPAGRPLVLAVLIPLLGFGAAAVRTEQVAAIKLTFRYYGPIEGRVIGIDRSQSDAIRLTLDRVVLRDTAPDRTPDRVRVSLHGDFGLPRPSPGAVIGLTGHLSPPGGAVEPGGYDFQRHAWFLGLGAVGYTRNPVVVFDPPEKGAGLWLLRLRFQIADRVREVLPGEAGGFAAAITTGDRSTLNQDTLETLRATNLAHLLAISGLHMGLLTGFVFAAIRLGLASITWTSLRLPTKKIAGSVSLVAGALYLGLSGNSVATERAYIMVAVMFCAVLVDRRAITLRSVAIAALIVLTFRPETLLGPGFQMSFAATTALVVVFGWFRDRDWSQTRWPWLLRVLGGAALSSAVAGLATAPIAAAHFNQIPHYGLLANVLSVPLMGLVVIPGAVIAALLSVIGAEAVGLAAMKWPILWILAVAREIATWNGALSHVPSPGPAVLPLIGFSGVAAAIVVGRARALAVPIFCAALWLWSSSDRPTALISESGGQVAVMNAEGLRVPSRSRGDGFATRVWLENDGDPATQAEAAERAAWVAVKGVRVSSLGAHRIVHGTGEAGSQAALEFCESDLVVVNREVTPPPNCSVLGPKSLSRTGAVSVTLDESGLAIAPTRLAGAGRRWSQ